MNYSETYFELDSEEATHSHPLSPIVILSVVCTLQGMCQYILFDAGGVEIQQIKAMSKTLNMVFAAFMQHCIQSAVTHLTHVEDAKYYCTLYIVASHPC